MVDTSKECDRGESKMGPNESSSGSVFEPEVYFTPYLYHCRRSSKMVHFSESY